MGIAESDARDPKCSLAVRRALGACAALGIVGLRCRSISYQVIWLSVVGFTSVGLFESGTISCRLVWYQSISSSGLVFSGVLVSGLVSVGLVSGVICNRSVLVSVGLCIYDLESRRFRFVESCRQVLWRFFWLLFGALIGLRLGGRSFRRRWSEIGVGEWF